jgi:hypothetical protein
VSVSATLMLFATRMPVEMHAIVKPMQVIAVVLLLLMRVGTRLARLIATKIIFAKLKPAKTHVTVTKKLAVALILNLNVGSQLVRGSARKILLAQKVPFAGRHVETQSRHYAAVAVWSISALTMLAKMSAKSMLNVKPKHAKTHA